jgi:SpoU rRNA methylase family enzyme
VSLGHHHLLVPLDRALNLSQPNVRIVSLIEINLNSPGFVVTSTRVRACNDGVPRCVTTAFTASNHGLLRLVTS